MLRSAALRSLLSSPLLYSDSTLFHFVFCVYQCSAMLSLMLSPMLFPMLSDAPFPLFSTPLWAPLWAPLLSVFVHFLPYALTRKSDMDTQEVLGVREWNEAVRGIETDGTGSVCAVRFRDSRDAEKVWRYRCGMVYREDSPAEMQERCGNTTRLLWDRHWSSWRCWSGSGVYRNSTTGSVAMVWTLLDFANVTWKRKQSRFQNV